MSSFDRFDAGKYHFSLSPELNRKPSAAKIVYAYTEDELLRQFTAVLKLEELDRLQTLLWGLQADWDGASKKLKALAEATKIVRNGKLPTVATNDRLRGSPGEMMIAVSRVVAVTVSRFATKHADGYERCPEVLTDKHIKGDHITVIAAMLVEAFRELLEQGGGPFASALLSEKLLNISVDRMVKKSDKETYAAFQTRRLKIIDLRLKYDEICNLKSENTAAKARVQHLEHRCEKQAALIRHLETTHKLLEEAREKDVDMIKQLRDAIEKYKAQMAQRAEVDAQLKTAQAEYDAGQWEIGTKRKRSQGIWMMNEAIRIKSEVEEEVEALKKETEALNAERDAADARATQAEADERQARGNLVRTMQMNQALDKQMKDLLEKNTELAQQVQALQERRRTNTQ